jgi:hypothetical protein
LYPIAGQLWLDGLWCRAFQFVTIVVRSWYLFLGETTHGIGD